MREKVGDQGGLNVSFQVKKSLLPFFMPTTKLPFGPRLARLLTLLLMLPLMAAASDTKVWVLLMQNPDSAQTIVSNNPAEKDGLIKAGWRLSGTGLTSTEGGQGRGLMHRMLRTKPAVDRQLAMSPEELATHTADGFVSEGAMGHVQLQSAPDLLPVHGFSKGGRRIWVIDHHDQYWADQNGWKRDGGIFWLRPVAVK
jgi:hypothetical protein